MSEIDDLSEGEVIDDRRVRLASVDSLLDGSPDSFDLISKEIARQALADEVVVTLESIRQDPSTPRTVLHALALEDNQSAPLIAARIGRQVADVRWILVALEREEVVSQIPADGRPPQYSIHWERTGPLPQDL